MQPVPMLTCSSTDSSPGVLINQTINQSINQSFTWLRPPGYIYTEFRQNSNNAV